MGSDIAIEFTDSLFYEKTGRHLNDLQCCILQQVWGGKTYGAIATVAGYSEGHIKDVAAQLWRLLSEALGERITKGNYRSRLKYWLKRAKHKVVQGITPVASSPAIDTPVTPTFIGREAALADIESLIRQGHKVIVIQGEGGLGKTTLAQHYLQQADLDLTLELLMAKETANITAVERVVEEWLIQEFQQEPGRDFGITLDRLKRQLKQRRVGILIDNLEPALDAQGQFLAPHRRYGELLRALADLSVNAVTLITSRDRLCEPGIKLQTYRLPGLTLAAWQQFFTRHTLTPINPSQAEPLQAMHRVYGGNAKAMEILWGTIQTDYGGDLATYWHLNQTDPLAEADLKNLVVSQVNRLQTLDPMAYKLLCCLGCYRYQEIASLPLSAVIAQLNPETAAQSRQVITSLRNRSLLEVRNGQYWLHPVVRAVAIERLKRSEDWHQANQNAATYWTQSITQIATLADGLQALEAYYHALEIQNYETAADTLLKSRHNQWGQFLPLASSLYRMGLLQPVIDAILQVLPPLETLANSSKVSELLNILGDAYWITGQIHQAIVCQQRALTATHRLLSNAMSGDLLAEDFPGSLSHYYVKMLNIDSRLSIGLYRIDLWELAAAKAQFKTVIALSQGTRHQAWATKATVALALVEAYLGNRVIAKNLADSVLDTFCQEHQPEHSGRFAYFMQLLGQTYSMLGDVNRAKPLCQQAITFAEAGHYVQIKARALTGLAVVYRQQGQPAVALAHHAQAIALLEALGAQCDLAEAHVQCGLTQQTPGLRPQTDGLSQGDQDGNVRSVSAKEHFARAIQLFAAIKAPQQVAKVEALALAASIRETTQP
jgi:tetratricopeptide (TPR) repeat protein